MVWRLSVWLERDSANTSSCRRQVGRLALLDIARHDTVATGESFQSTRPCPRKCTFGPLYPSCANNKRKSIHRSPPFPSHFYRAKMLQYLEGYRSVVAWKFNEEGVDVSLPLQDETERTAVDLAGFCRSLPATQLWIVVVGRRTLLDWHQLVVESGALVRALEAWKALGNSWSPLEVPTFRIADKMSPPKQRGRSHRDGISSIRTELSDSIAAAMGWTPLHTSAGVDPSFSFRLRFDEDAPSYSLDLLAMDRTWPLPDPQKPPSLRRLESFIVARSANLQPHNVVWDPFCQRGTFLIEAAKYWPAATYLGTDINLGHLEHCQMNAQSTCSRLHLYHHPQQQTNRSSDALMQALSEIGIAGVDKILTCLPFHQSLQTYKDLLMNWSHLLLPHATIVLVVEVSSLPRLQEAVIQSSGSFRIALVRNPPFLWGKKQRVTLVIVDFLGNETGTGEPEVATAHSLHHVGLLDWEEKALAATKVGTVQSQSPSATSQFWATVRAETIPWMIPYTDRKVRSSRIRLPSGKFV